MDPLDALERTLGHAFADRGLLVRALTHRSYANEVASETRDNQRMEFLGDAILGLVISEALFERFPEFQEGALSRVKSNLVCETRLAKIAGRLGIGAHILLGRGEDGSGGRDKPSVLADCYEALVAAVHLDGGFDAGRDFVMRHHDAALDAVTSPRAQMDAKSQLQELLQQDHGARPSYRITCVDGPDHNRQYTAQVSLGEDVLGEGIGRSKKEAQQNAATAALSAIEEARVP